MTSVTGLTAPARPELPWVAVLETSGPSWPKSHWLPTLPDWVLVTLLGAAWCGVVAKANPPIPSTAAAVPDTMIPVFFSTASPQLVRSCSGAFSSGSTSDVGSPSTAFDATGDIPPEQNR